MSAELPRVGPLPRSARTRQLGLLHLSASGVVTVVAIALTSYFDLRLDGRDRAINAFRAPRNGAKSKLSSGIGRPKKMRSAFSTND
jgi:hypothetical protein